MIVARRAWPAVALATAFTLLGPVCVARADRAVTNPPRAADSPATAGRSHHVPVPGSRPSGHRVEPAQLHKASGGQPLVASTGGTFPATGDAGGTGEAEGEPDPLVSNGLGSPLCAGAAQAGLSVASRRDCQTSGFVAAAAPTDNYGIDVHIDTGAFGLSSGGLLSTVQDLFVTPIWMALVWTVHAVLVMLEWSFQIDLLDGSAGTIGSALREMQSALTLPWLFTVLPIAAVLTAYKGLVRRRVSDAIGDVLLMAAMIVGGMGVMLDPVGTVGAIGSWANQASLGTLAVAASGVPSKSTSALGDDMGTVFDAVVEAPWCYLEFGDVSWCREPAQLDPALRTAALRISGQEQALIGCREASSQLSGCVGRGSAQASALRRSAELLNRARSNGAIFLSLPANGPARNSINETNSLLRTLCGNGEATKCHGPTAGQAEFRTNSGTWPRVGGLLLIVAGALGMLLLLGFIVLRLLGSALLALLYLLMAPAAVLAPALGDVGRAVFRRWAVRLLGAVLSKLMYSFVLGVVLAIAGIVVELRALGWWTQWLLLSAFWWGVFARRHQALGFFKDTATPGGRARGPSGIRRVREVLASPRSALGLGRPSQSRGSKPAPDPGGRSRITRAVEGAAPATIDVQVEESLRGDRERARSRVAGADRERARIADLRAKATRLGSQREQAANAGDTRRAANLGLRAARAERELAQRKGDLLHAEKIAFRPSALRRAVAGEFTNEARTRRGAWLDAQAALLRGGRVDSAGARRDYPALATLIGSDREAYERLDPGARRAARLHIDRELAARSPLATSPGDRADREGRPTGLRPEPRSVSGVAPGATAGAGAGAKRPRALPVHPDQLQSGPRRPPGAGSSPVMDDAREVAARRKRQLGWNRR